MPVLAVEDLCVAFGSGPRAVPVVSGVSFAVEAGRTLAIVGGSGSGKSVSLLGATGLLPPTARVSGSARHEGTELIGLSREALRRKRGSEIGFVFQDPLSNLHPLRTIGAQVAEAITAHRRMSGRPLRERVLGLLHEVGIRDPEHRLGDYPHQFSGGMRQRVMIAIASALRPALLIADEPTTALDVTVQASILRLFKRLQAEHGTALVFVSHDLAVVSDIADDVVVMRGGRIVEQAPAAALFVAPDHDYTRALLEAARHGRTHTDPRPRESSEEPLVRAEGLVRRYPNARGAKTGSAAVDDVTFSIGRSEILGLVGESGSGKSTIGRILAGFDRPDFGRVRFDGTVYGEAGQGAPRLSPGLRSAIQVIFQDPYASLNPRRTVGAILAEPFRIAGGLAEPRIRQRVTDLLRTVDLPTTMADRRPAELSGGQRQRVAIGRALALEPRLLIADEPVSALDVTTQRRIVDLLRRLRDRLGVAILFISHDLGVVSDLCDRVVVLNAGRIVERGTTADVFRRPRDAYTRELVAAIPGRGRFDLSSPAEQTHV